MWFPFLFSPRCALSEVDKFAIFTASKSSSAKTTLLNDENKMRMKRMKGIAMQLELKMRTRTQMKMETKTTTTKRKKQLQNIVVCIRTVYKELIFIHFYVMQRLRKKEIY